jgi:hypothetical protein
MSPFARFLLVLFAAGVLTACDCGGAKPCQVDADCGEGAVCDRAACVLLPADDAGGPDDGADSGVIPDAGDDAGTDAGFDGGLDAGSDAGADAGDDGGADAGVDAGDDAGSDAGADAGFDAGTDAGLDAGPLCNPLCFSWTACVPDGGCDPRYSAVTLLSPPTGVVLDGGPAAVLATLDLAASMSRADPSQLLFRATSADAGFATASVNLLRVDAGRYTGTWVPAGEGTFRLTASFPDAGLNSADSLVRIDKTPPAFYLAPEIGMGPARPPDAGFTFSDVGTPGARPWRRDEVVTTQVHSSSVDVDPASVVVTVSHGPSGSPASFPVTQVSPCDAGYCGQVSVDLSKPGFNTFRGTVDVSITGRDWVGNAGTSAASPFLLTRWKWRFTSSSPSRISWPPAIGKSGTVYAALSGQGTNTSSIVALEPDGRLAWEEVRADTKIAGNLFVGAPTVGSPDLVYVVRSRVSLAETNYLIYTGDLGTNLWGTTSGTAAFVGPVTAVPNLNGPGDCFVHLASATELRAVCPPVAYSGSPTLRSATLVQAEVGAVANGSTTFACQQSGMMPAFQLTASAFSAVTGWPTSAPCVALPAVALADGFLLVPGSSLNGVSLTSASTIWAFPAGGAGTPVAAKRGADLYLKKGNFDLVQLPIGQAVAGQTLTFSAPSRKVVDSPMLSSGGGLYASVTDPLTASSDLISVSGSLGPLWTLPGILSNASAPALDCARIAGAVAPGPGVLYVGDSTGSVYAFVVDHRGVDVTGQWPKLLHDPRNTNNAATPLGPFACP